MNGVKGQGMPAPRLPSESAPAARHRGTRHVLLILQRDQLFPLFPVSPAPWPNLSENLILRYAHSFVGA